MKTLDMSKSSTLNYEVIIDDYRDILKQYNEEPTDDEIILKFRKLNTEEKAILALYIACEYRITILARLLHTNTVFAKKLITNIQDKIKQME